MTPPRLRVWVGPRRGAPIVALIVLFHAQAPSSWCGDLDVRAGLSYGVDSNPLELASDERSGAFTEAAIGVQYGPSPRSRLGFVAEARGVRRWYQGAVDGADTGWSDARAGLAAVPYASGSRRFAILAGGTGSSYRMTLIDPDTGEIYRQVSGSGTTVSIGDRLDFDSHGAFVDLRWQTGRSLLLYVNGEWTRRDYVEDYEGSAGLESLDDRTTTVEPGVRARIARGVVLDLSWARSRREYDELSSLDENAVEAPGEEREYVTSRWQAAVRLDPRGRWEVLAGYRSTSRSDRHAGYYDTRGASAVLSVGYSPGERTHLRLLVSDRTLAYQNASVNNDPSEPIRRSGIVRYVGRVEREIGSYLTAFASAGREDYDSRDPAYVHDRTWVQAGLELGI